MSTPRNKPRMVNEHLLPPQLRMLVRIMGDTAAYRLVQERGGGYLIVPVHVSPEHPLCELLGPAAFAALVRELGSQTLQLPKYDSVARQWRHQQVHALREQGKTLCQVALKTNYSMRQVINIMRDAEGDSRQQIDLFASMDETDVDADLAGGDEPMPTAHNPFGL